MLITVLAIRLLGGVEYGHLATWFSLFVLYLSLNSSIYTVLVTKFIALPSNNPSSGAAEILSSAIFFSVLSIIFLALLTFVVSGWGVKVLMRGSGDADSLARLRLAVLLIGLMTALQILTALNCAVIEGAGRLDLAMKWQLTGSVSSATILLLILLLNIQLGTNGYMSILCFGALLDFWFTSRIRRALQPIVWNEVRNSGKQIAQVIALLKSGATLQAGSLTMLFLEPLNKFLLTHFSGPQTVASYDLVMKSIWGIQSLFAAAMRIFLHLSNEPKGFVGSFFFRVLALILIPVLGLHAAVAVFLGVLVHGWVVTGSPGDLMTFFGLATLSNLGMILISPLYISLIGHGAFRFILKSQTVVAVANGLASTLLIPKLGLVGAAIGLLIATMYNVVAIYSHYRRTIGLGGAPLHAASLSAGRLFMALGLLVVAISLGARPTINHAAMGAVLLAIAIVLIREPLTEILLTQGKASS